jgi:RNA polymerase sigma-32 factor
MLSAEEESVLIEELRAGCANAFARLLASHLRLVTCVARRYARNGIAMDDLIGEGNLGLVEAARRFDPDRGTRFSTYAAWWVRAYVRGYALANRRIVPLPSTRNARKVLWRLSTIERALSQQMGRTPHREEVAAALQVEPDDVAMVQGALGARDISLGWSDEGRGIDLPDAQPSPETLAAELEAQHHNHWQIAAALETLTPREREIIKRRLLTDEVATLAMLGESLGLSRERVRQLEKRAELKLRSALHEKVA